MIDWDAVRLAIFDVDGTLYDQRRLRIGMAFKLLRHCLLTGDVQTPRVLASYRAMREDLGNRGTHNFEDVLAASVAARHGWPQAKVRATVAEWIDKNPLPLLRNCRYEGVAELFQALRASGRVIGVLSDYPAVDKLAALGLRADHVVSAVDATVGVLKPDPRGLLHLVRIAGVTVDRTVMIGDRADRDGEMGRRAGVKTYLRSSKPIEGWPCFRAFSEIALGAT